MLVDVVFKVTPCARSSLSSLSSSRTCFNVCHMLTSFSKLQVGDFGLSTHLNNYGEYGVALPLKWTAPEAIDEGKFTVKSDVWSMGVLLIELVT